ncbi:MAG: DUF6282 family protein [Acidimicrobiales bacterium]
MGGRRPDLELLRGAIDMHAHTAPALFPRPIRDQDLARYALEYNMRGFVLKDHDSATFHRANNLKASMPGLDPIGAIVLNRSVGGINPYVVEAALHYGAKVIWMPSNHSKHHDDYFGIPDYPQLGRERPLLPGPGVTILDENGQLTSDAKTIVRLVHEAGACLCTGHLHLDETRLLLDEANRVGLERFVVTHVNWALTKYDLDVQRELVGKGAYLEIVAISCVSPTFYEQTPAELAPWLDAHKGEHLILSSDLGQGSGPPHPEGLRMLAYSLLAEGVDYSTLERMMKENPAFLVGLAS